MSASAHRVAALAAALAPTRAAELMELLAGPAAAEARARAVALARATRSERLVALQDALAPAVALPDATPRALLARRIADAARARAATGAPE